MTAPPPRGRPPASSTAAAVGAQIRRRREQRGISSGHSLEIWRLRVPPNTELHGVPHATGTTEHLLIATGHLTAGPTGTPTALHPGDLFAFAGDAPHVYRTGEAAADVTVVIASPIVG